MSELLGKRCRKGCKIEVLKSGAGYYIGTLTEDGMPGCRLTTGYAKTSESAKLLPLDRVCMENDFCHQGFGCMNNPIVVWTHNDQLVCAINEEAEWDIYTADEWVQGEGFRSKEWEGCGSLEEALEWCESWEPTEFDIEEIDIEDIEE